MSYKKINFQKESTDNSIGIIILFYCACNLFLRLGYELHFGQIPYYFDQQHINSSGSTWYTYMFPNMSHTWGGTWSSLGIGLLPILKKFPGITASYLMLNLLFAIFAYVLTWRAFYSRVLTITVGLCTTFTSLNYHVYSNASLVMIYIPFIFCFFNLFSIYRLFQENTCKYT
jgi:hypothetical protein